ncbi:polyprenol phosphomannose-dependent alpha 1,6 mannosyltransferase MptB [Nocardioides jiangxiensis]|uniref:Polyprenol phosphomannose-dependent alpha 1,6 mannosyltransferase MptB n=1 Tax=Nocardioides jiangxiensis TaxID=3064524 RepID=A0ABT9B1T0_9ACTN|nr:polyprenol phosphomannose-dependent alpha 1,6 mannosyltransferase MptB [Nocardioides sp. WY-20]MDO7868643.1 polyprenol phosphomannose-dependent alpha 1,6 mannosyltransferase MptB [Nocardioides sp. WY-20]
MLLRGTTGSVLVLLGGLVIVPMPAGNPVLLALPWLRLLRHHDPHGRVLALGVVLTGLALLSWAWCSLLRTTGRLDDRAGVRLARSAVTTWSLPLVVAPPLFSRDGWSYAAQGMMTRLGISPYEHGPAVLTGPIVAAVDPQWMHTLTPYGPLPLALGSLAARVTGDPWLLVIADRLVALLGLALLAWAVPRMAAWAGTSPGWASAFVLASPLMLAHGVGGLHNDVLMVGLMAAALVVGVERSWVAGCLLGGLAAAVKVPGGLVCVPLLLASLPVGASFLRRCGRLVVGAALAGAVLVGVGLASGLGVGWVHGLSVPAVIDTPLSVPTELGDLLGRLSHHLGGPPHRRVLHSVRAVATAGSLLVVVLVALRGRTGNPRAGLRAALLLYGTLVLGLPAVQPWYLLWLLPFAAAAGMRRRTAAPVGALLVLGSLLAPLQSTFHVVYRQTVLDLVRLGMAVVVLAGCLVTVRAVRRRRPRDPGTASDGPAGGLAVGP